MTHAYPVFFYHDWLTNDRRDLIALPIGVYSSWNEAKRAFALWVLRSPVESEEYKLIKEGLLRHGVSLENYYRISPEKLLNTIDEVEVFQDYPPIPYNVFEVRLGTLFNFEDPKQHEHLYDTPKPVAWDPKTFSVVADILQGDIVYDMAF